MKYALIVFILLAIVAAAALAQQKPRAKEGAYRRRKILSDNEGEFFGRLVQAFPDHYIFPQVAMTALLEASSSDKKQAHADRLRIAQLRVDYVVCDTSCNIVAVVELDDRTHVKEKDQQRDARLAKAGIRTIRFQSRSKPTPVEIRAQVLGPMDQEKPPAKPQVQSSAAQQ